MLNSCCLLIIHFKVLNVICCGVWLRQLFINFVCLVQFSIEIASLAKGIVAHWMDKVKEKSSSDGSSKHSGETCWGKVIILNSNQMSFLQLIVSWSVCQY